MQVPPDWMKRFDTAATLELYLNMKPGEFAGPGLYLSKTDTLLVTGTTPKGESSVKDLPWAGLSHWPEGTIWTAYVYNCPVERTILNSRIAVKQDNR